MRELEKELVVPEVLADLENRQFVSVFNLSNANYSFKILMK